MHCANVNLLQWMMLILSIVDLNEELIALEFTP